MLIAIRRRKNFSRCQWKGFQKIIWFCFLANNTWLFPNAVWARPDMFIECSVTLGGGKIPFWCEFAEERNFQKFFRFSETWNYCLIVFRNGYWARPHVVLICLSGFRHWNSFFMNPRPCIESKSCRLILHTWLCSSIYDLCTSICMYSNSCQNVKLDKLSKLS